MALHILGQWRVSVSIVDRLSGALIPELICSFALGLVSHPNICRYWATCWPRTYYVQLVDGECVLATMRDVSASLSLICSWVQYNTLFQLPEGNNFISSPFNHYKGQNSQIKLITCLYIGCTLPVHCPYIGCTLSVHCLYIGCTLPVHCLYIACTLAVHWLYIGCTLPVYCL